jgi:hypothetical protein
MPSTFPVACGARAGIRCYQDATRAAIAGVADLQGRQLFSAQVAGLRFIRRQRLRLQRGLRLPAAG